MAQAVSRLPLTAESVFAPGSIHVRFVDKVALGQVSLRVFRFHLSISFHRHSPYSHIICGMNNMSVSGSGSET
jgi:hypothetical protein